VKQVLKWARYAPLGLRGMSLFASDGTDYNAVSDYAEVCAVQNQNVMIGLMIETVEALDTIEEMRFWRRLPRSSSPIRSSRAARQPSDLAPRSRSIPPAKTWRTPCTRQQLAGVCSSRSTPWVLRPYCVPGLM
jgi:hypothetical protein